MSGMPDSESQGEGCALEMVDELQRNLYDYNKKSGEKMNQLKQKAAEAVKLKDELEKERNELKASLFIEKQEAEEIKKLNDDLGNELRASAKEMEKLKEKFERESNELKTSIEQAKQDHIQKIKELEHGLKNKSENMNIAETSQCINNHYEYQKENKKLEGKLSETGKSMRETIWKRVEKKFQKGLKTIFEELDKASKERQDLRSGTDERLPTLMEQLKKTENIVSEKERTSCQEKLCSEIHAITDKLFKENEGSKERREELDKIWNSLDDELEMKLRELEQNELKEELLHQLQKMRETVEKMRENDEKSAENLRMLEILLQQKEAEIARLKENMLKDLEDERRDQFLQRQKHEVENRNLLLAVSNILQAIPTKTYKHLTHLNLLSRNIISLPDNLFQHQLEIVRLSGNEQLQSLPSPGDCLRELIVDKCNIKVLPDDLFHHNLEDVSLNGNKGLTCLPGLPLHPAKSRLKHLHAAECAIATLQSSLLRPGLSIYLQENSITRLPKKELMVFLQAGGQIDSIHLEHNPLEYPPLDVINKGKGAILEFLSNS